MRFLIDECVSRDVCIILAASGHDAAHVVPDLASATDIEVLRAAGRMDRILVTNDRGFLRFAASVTPPPFAAIVTDEKLPDEIARQIESLGAIERGERIILRKGRVRRGSLNSEDLEQ